ncbi:MAG: membrane dipeptidase, partial [FCB group bacterium]|nr:membrane dipeptidase [FCB group bacterium]
MKFHSASFVADTHNDVLLRVMRGEDITKRTDTGHSDLPRLKEGGVDLQVFAVWVNPDRYLPDSAFIRANEMIDALYAVATRAPDRIAVTESYTDLLLNERKGILSAVIGVEGGHPIENSLGKLEQLYNRGMRCLGFTWNNSTDWATSARDETEAENLPFKGLTLFGKSVVRKCNELGIIIDVSHVGEQTFRDILETTSQPVIASHSSVYALCPHYRNLKDDQLQAIKANGGVVFINFYAGYLDPAFEQNIASIEEKYRSELDSLKTLYGEHSDEYWYRRQAILKAGIAGIAPSLDVLIDHIDYVAKLIGPEHVGLGSDFDGVSALPKQMEDCTYLPAITGKLLERGYSKHDIQ